MGFLKRYINYETYFKYIVLKEIKLNMKSLHKHKNFIIVCLEKQTLLHVKLKHTRTHTGNKNKINILQFYSIVC